MSSNDRLLTIQEVSALLCVSVERIEGWVQYQEIPCHWIGSEYKFKEAEVRDWYTKKVDAHFSDLDQEEWE